MLFFFFKQKTAYELRISDWSSDVCSSDLSAGRGRRSGRASAGGARPPTPAPAPQSVALELRAQREPALLGVAHLSLDRVQLVAEAVQRSVIGAGGCVLHVRSEEHTSELQSLMRTSYAVFWLKKKKVQRNKK